MSDDKSHRQIIELRHKATPLEVRDDDRKTEMTDIGERVAELKRLREALDRGEVNMRFICYKRCEVEETNISSNVIRGNVDCDRDFEQVAKLTAELEEARGAK